MACFDYYGNLGIADNLVSYAHKASRQIHREGLYGVTTLEFYRRSSYQSSQELIDFVSKVGIDISHMDNANLQEVSLVMSKPLEMHNDGDLFVKYGVLIMLDVPEGTVLLQNNGEPIYPVRGDVIGIRYARQHGVDFKHHGSRLFFMSFDFKTRKQSLCDQWRALVNEASGGLPPNRA